MPILTIEPAAGLGEIRFGATCDEARRYFGEPSHILRPADEPRRQIWVYDGLLLAAGFDESGVLDTFEIFNPAATLHGYPIIGLDVERAALLLRSEFAFPIEALMHEDDSIEQLRIRDLGFGAWIEDEIVRSVSWSDALGEEDQSTPQTAPH